ncbi:LysR family transcriptional regulator [Verminephrobacter eiseniae]|uniref:Transcriptional regulator, LysR family n=1 Tax=Verminephrobacter eiseniae (strain EF01-2) TaxID=391735 RepID=A1WS10_VEREI|nr:LysR family transcriptional regulator [Verminephrobacter eiseniae]KAB7585010.1 LysR family transcriptional regulator [Verminephrobacter sp. Larva24]ABM60417.1 transcriptional regulator, LysR family [Verminephrobacter eiseniae EF01-2]MCW5232562.1 LysR family transcriptional regulator [Verminephrobacter eiseniae]MCW5260668.1 LysR family transcriptional regulator [Verminephrobacter eiseniae]MCW5285892.1 LysR family transcriptional regulator [Verminephrobacter eiseniae]
MSTIRFLRTFVAAAHGGSFAAAADRVALTQAAVGQQMRALEAELRTTLFDKTGRNMALTPAGHLLLPRAMDLLGQYDALRRDVQDQQSIAGTLKLGSPITGMGLLSTTLAELKCRHPDLEVELRVQDQSRLVDDVVSGALDAALVVERQWPQGLLWTQCYAETLTVIANASIADADTSIASLFAAHPFIRFDHRTPTGAHIDKIMRDMRLVPNEFLELNSLLSIIELVRKNVGFTMAPLLKNFDWESDSCLRVLHLPSRPIARRLGILENGRRSRITGVVREELLEQLRRMP